LYDDPGLALAFTTSLRHAILPTLRVDGTFVAAESLYVDSLELRRMLRHAAPPVHEPQKGMQTSRALPIFFFSSDSDLPLFIDRYFQSRSVDDLVIVVQSDYSDWESRMICGHYHLPWNLRTPLRAALAATAEQLGGVLSPHLAYEAETKRARQNWLWSVGDSPFAYTSSGAEFGTHYASVLHRHYVVGALNASVSLVAEAVHVLSALRTSRSNAVLLDGSGAEELPFLRLQSAHAKVVQLQRRILAHASRSEFDEASVLLHALQKGSQALVDLALELVRAFDPLRCAPADTSSFLWRWLTRGYTLPALLALGGVVALAWALGILVGPRPRRKRPKVNID